MRWADLGITPRLIVTLSICGGLIFAVVFTVNEIFTGRMVEQQVVAHSRDVVAAAVGSLDMQLSGVARDTAALAARLESAQHLSPATLDRMLREHVTAHEEIFGSTAAFEPSLSPRAGRPLAPYVCKQPNGKLSTADLASPAYDYRSRKWYAAPMESRAPTWSEPYFDEGGGNVLMSTYAIPFYLLRNGKRCLAGVVTSDISIDWLGKQVSSLKLHHNGYAALFSRTGDYLAHPDRSLVMKETLAGVADKVGSPQLKEIGLAIARQEKGFVKGRNIYGRESWIYFAPVPANGWFLAVVFPAEEMMAEAVRARRVIVVCCLFGILLLVLSIVLVARSVTRPLADMIVAVRRIAGGDLDGELPPVRIGGEVGELARSVTRMQGDLKEHIRQLTETTAAKERMAGELAIAHDIQMSLLPVRLPELTDFELAGCCLPAREVGGDFYDAVLWPDGRLFFIIGDVSGKGVPAALYMAMATTLARAGAREGDGLKEILGRINCELCQGNDSCMFATILCGVLDPSDGGVLLANAGHTRPALLCADGSSRFLSLAPGLVAGYVEHAEFGSGSHRLSPGDTLLLYTDGITEAMNREGELFGEERLLAALAAAPASAVGASDAIMAAVGRFAGDLPQADDITLLVIRYGA